MDLRLALQILKGQGLARSAAVGFGAEPGLSEESVDESAPESLPDVEQPADQRSDPLQRPPLILIPAVHCQAFVQLAAQPGQLPGRQPAHRLARALEASAAAQPTRQHRRH